MLKRSAVLAALLLLGTLSLASGAPVSSSVTMQRPNIVFILTDDLDANFDSIHVMPTLKSEITDKGTAFSRYYVSLSMCCPSRTTTLRGQYAHNTKIYTNYLPNGGFESVYRLGLEKSTIAVWLKDAGYRTALFGKYLNGYPNGVSQTYIPPGWSEWFSPVAGHPYSEYNYTLNENGTLAKHGHKPDDYLVDVMSTRVNDFIRRAAAANQPFFTYVSTYAPHGPATPAPRYADRFPGEKAPRFPSFDEADISDKPEWIRNRQHTYARQIEHIDKLYRKRLQSLLGVDDLIAGVLKTLQEAGQLNNTYIFFASDNGFHLGEHRLPTGKNTEFEEDLRVPLIVRGPGVPAGKTTDYMGVNVDLAPTFAELAGVKVPDLVDGRSLVPVLTGKAQPLSAWRQAVLLEHAAEPNEGEMPTTRLPLDSLLEPSDVIPDKLALRRSAKEKMFPPVFTGLRTADYTYIEYVTGERELYDMNKDPYQLQNIAATADKSLLTKLSAWLASLANCKGDSCRSAESNSGSPNTPIPGRIQIRHTD